MLEKAFSNGSLLLLTCLGWIFTVNGISSNLTVDNRDYFTAYSPDHSYAYAFELRHKVAPAVGLGHDHHQNPSLIQHLALKGQALLTPMSPRESSLKFTNVVQSNNGNEHSRSMLIRDLENYPIIFHYAQGQVKTIRHAIKDTFDSINVKKAFLSHLQLAVESLNLPTRFTEIDLSGNCMTELVPIDEDASPLEQSSNDREGTVAAKFTKIKHLAGCGNKFSLQVGSLPSKMADKVKETSNFFLFDTSHNCTIDATINGPVRMSRCDEQWLIHTLDVNRRSTTLAQHSSDSATLVKVETLIELIDVTRSEVTNNHSQTSLEFSDPTSLLPVVSNSRQIQSTADNLTLDDIQSSNRINLSSFYDLVTRLRSMDRNRLETLFNSFLHNSKLDEEFRQRFLNLLKLLATPETVDVVMDNSATWQVDEYHRSQLLVSIMDHAVNPFLQSMVKLKESLSLFATFDNRHSDLLLAIARQLGTSCSNPVPSNNSRPLDVGAGLCTDQVKEVKRQLANIQWSRLDQACRNNERQSIEEELLWKVIGNVKQDIEVRVEAVKTLLHCPSESKFEKLLDLLEKEVSQQFASYTSSYLWSHLPRLSPRVLERLRQLQKTSMAFLTWTSYSKHYRRSYQLLSDVEIQVALDVVFGPESFIPRVIGLHVTSNAFGFSFELVRLKWRSTEQHLLRDLFKGTHDLADKEPEPRNKTDGSYAFLHLMDRSVTYFWPNVVRQFAKYLRPTRSQPAGVKGRGSSANWLVDNHMTLDPSSMLLHESQLRFTTTSGLPIEIDYALIGSIQLKADTQLALWPPSYRVDWNYNASMGLITSVALTVKDEQINDDGDSATVIRLGRRQDRLVVARLEWKSGFELDLWRTKEVGDSKSLEFYMAPLPSNYPLMTYRLTDQLITSSDHQQFIDNPDIRQRKEHNHDLLSTSKSLTSWLGLELSLPVTTMSSTDDDISSKVVTKSGLIVVRFDGIDFRFNLVRRSPLRFWGNIERLNFLLEQPRGISREVDANDIRVRRFELNINVRNGSATSELVQFKITSPWTSEMAVECETDRNGSVHASGAFGLHKYAVKGFYHFDEGKGVHKFTARPSSVGPTPPTLSNATLLTFRGKSIVNFNLFFNSPNGPVPLLLKISQHPVNVSHHTFPDFYHALHHSSLLIGTRSDDSSHSFGSHVDFTLDFKRGRHRPRGDRLSEARFGLNFGLDGAARSGLEGRVGFTSLSTVDRQHGVLGHEQNASILAFSSGAVWFKSDEFLLQHTGKPAIVRAEAFISSPLAPHINASGRFNLFSHHASKNGVVFTSHAGLDMPAQEISALIRADFNTSQNRNQIWRSLDDFNATLLIRIYPNTPISKIVHDTNESKSTLTNDRHAPRYFKVAIWRQLAKNYSIGLRLELRPDLVYSLGTKLVRGQSRNELTLTWPRDHFIKIISKFDMDPHPSGGGGSRIWLQNDVAFDHDQPNYAQMTVLSETQPKIGRMQFAHGLTRDNGTRLVYWINYSHQCLSQGNFYPLKLQYAIGGLLQVMIPYFKVDLDLDLGAKLKLDTWSNFEIGLTALRHFNLIDINQTCPLAKSENGHRSGIEWLISFDKQEKKTIAKILFNSYPLYPRYSTNDQSPPQSPNGCQFHYSSNRTSRVSRSIAVDCSQVSLGSFSLHEKYRSMPSSKLQGSLMMSIDPVDSNGLSLAFNGHHRFTGLYFNSNYQLKTKKPRDLSFSLHTEYSLVSGVGPGTQTSFKFSHTDSSSQRDVQGQIETMLISQPFGYLVGYEMLSVLIGYRLVQQHDNYIERLDEGEGIKLTSNAIASYRTYEGRGAKVFQGGLEVGIGRDRLDGKLRFGSSGQLAANGLDIAYIFQPEQLLSLLKVIYATQVELDCYFKVNFDPSSLDLQKADMRLTVPRLDFVASLNESLGGEEIDSTNYQLQINRDMYLVSINKTDIILTNERDSWQTVQFHLSTTHQPITSQGRDVTTRSYNYLVYSTLNHLPLNKVSINIKHGVDRVKLSNKSIRTRFGFALDAALSQDGNSQYRMDLNLARPTQATSSVINLKLSSPDKQHLLTNVDWGDGGKVYRHLIAVKATNDGWYNWTTSYQDNNQSNSEFNSWYSSDTRLTGFSRTIESMSEVSYELAANKRTNPIETFKVTLTDKLDGKRMLVHLPSSRLIKGFYVKANNSYSTLFNIGLGEEDASSNKSNNFVQITLQKSWKASTDKQSLKQQWTINVTSNLLKKRQFLVQAEMTRNATDLDFGTVSCHDPRSSGSSDLRVVDLKIKANNTESDLHKVDLEYHLFNHSLRMRANFSDNQIEAVWSLGDKNRSEWNLLFRPFTRFKLSNSLNTTKLTSVLSTNRNPTEIGVSQVIHLASGQISTSHSTALRFHYPITTALEFKLLSKLSSNNGDALLYTTRSNPTDLQVKLVHAKRVERRNQSTTGTETDVYLRFHVLDRQLVKVDMHWKPTFLNDALLYGTSLTDPKVIESIYAHNINSTIDWFNKDLVGQIEKWILSELIEQDDINALLTSLQLRFKSITSTLRTCYEQDHFWIKSAGWRWARKLSQINATRLEGSLNDARATARQLIINVWHHLAYNTSWLLDDLEAIRKSIASDGRYSIKPTFDALLRAGEVVVERALVLANQAFDLAVPVSQSASHLKKGFDQWTGTVAAYLVNQPSACFIQTLESIVKQLTTGVVTKSSFDRLESSNLTNSLTLFGRLLAEQKRKLETLAFNTLLSHQFTNIVTLLANGSVDRARLLLFQPQLTNHMLDLGRGRARLSLYVPDFIWHSASLITLVRGRFDQLYQMVKGPTVLESMFNAYNLYQYSIKQLRNNLNHLLPPYDITAWLVTSFNGHAYVFSFNELSYPVPISSNRSFLLLRDTRLDDLTITQTFTNVSSNWLTSIELANQIEVIVSSRGKVTVLHKFNQSSSSQTISLPWRSEPIVGGNLTESTSSSLLIQRLGQTRLQLDWIDDGQSAGRAIIRIIFDLDQGRIQFRLAGHSDRYGQCQGLLGVNSFDRLEELKRSNQTNSFNPLTVASHWLVDQSTANGSDNGLVLKELNALKALSLSDKAFHWCQGNFSLLSDCQSQHDHKAWIDACLLADAIDQSDSSAWRRREMIGRHVCRIVSAYIEACSHGSALVRVPSECVTCSNDIISSTTDRVGSQQNESTKHRHLFLVIEVVNCLTNRLGEIEQLIELLNEGEASVVYSAVLVSTNLQVPSWITFNDGRINMTGQELIVSLKEQAKDFSERLTKSGRSSEHLLIDGIRLLLRHADSVDVIDSHLLVFACSSCVSSNRLTYSSIQSLIARKGMTFHYLPNFKFKTADGLTDHVISLDSNKWLMTLRGQVAGNLTLSASPNRVRRVKNQGWVVVRPHDQCSLIALSINWAFVSKGTVKGAIWARQDKSLQRSTITLLASEIKQAPSIAKKCFCRDNHYGSGRLECNVSP